MRYTGESSNKFICFLYKLFSLEDVFLFKNKFKTSAENPELKRNLALCKEMVRVSSPFFYFDSSFMNQRVCLEKHNGSSPQ